MEGKSRQRNVRFSKPFKQNVVKDNRHKEGSSLTYAFIAGTRLDIPVMPENVPRVSAIHTGNDKKFLADNRGKMLDIVNSAT